MNLVMNEAKYAEAVLNGAEFDENRLYTLTALAKYYKSKGYGDSRIRAELEHIMNERIPALLARYGNQWIKKALEAANVHLLYVIENISITKPEMELIQTIHSDKFKDHRVKKLAFALLCIAKYNTFKGIKNNWVNTDVKNVFRIANLNHETKSVQSQLMHELYKVGYIDINRRVGSNGIRVLGVIPGETEIVVDDINEAGYVFDEYSGKKFVRCKKCGKRVPVNNNRNIYCSKCAIEADREKAKERMKKYRM